MSQVISIKVPANFDDACAMFRNEAGITGTNNKEFMIFYDSTTKEIRCEGSYPDSILLALEKTKDQFGGTLFYEGEEWTIDLGEKVEEASTLEKARIILMIVFFPVTIVYLLLRTFIWLPYKIWKETR